MLGKILGISELNFTTKQNELVEGIKLYYGYSDENVKGLRCDSIFIKNKSILPDDLRLGETYNLIFDCKGKLETILSAK